MPDEISNEKVKFALETWKIAIQVQQHFNTIEMQIRNIAVTVLTATIGVAGLVFNQMQETIREAIKANQPIPATHNIQILGLGFSSADMIVVGGLIAWLAFYFMDRWWYHRLLQGAVKHAQHIEDIIKETEFGDLMSLSNSIRTASPFKFLGIIKIHSDTKIDLFYGIVLVVSHAEVDG